jgi:hypothetical protein
MSALATFRELVEADVLIMSKSSFSYVAAILNDRVKSMIVMRARQCRLGLSAIGMVWLIPFGCRLYWLDKTARADRDQTRRG